MMNMINHILNSLVRSAGKFTIYGWWALLFCITIIKDLANVGDFNVQTHACIQKSGMQGQNNISTSH